jgi:tetratricopeptide (TPR) repeat protein
MKAFLLIIFLFITVFVQASNAEQLKCRFQQMYIHGEMNSWKVLVDSMRKTKITADENEVLLFAEYGLIGYLIGIEDKKSGRSELEKFEKHIDEGLKKQPQNASFYALKAASVGYRIWLQPYKAVYLGTDNQKAIDKALLYRKNEPLPLIESANALYFRPIFAGGDKKKAVNLYKQALEIYKKSDHCQWLYLHIYTWLGQYYAHKGDKTTARNLYNDILKEYPNYNWVKNELLPELEADKKRFLFLDIEN